MTGCGSSRPNGRPDGGGTDAGSDPTLQDADHIRDLHLPPDRSRHHPDQGPPPPDHVGPPPNLPPPSGVSSATHHGDNARSGWYKNEPSLSPAAVMGGFGPASGSAPGDLDGQIYGGVLYLGQVPMTSGGPRAVVYVATMNNSVYALDAQTGARKIWTKNLGSPVPADALDCNNFNPVIGILSHPVIDEASGTLYAVGYTTTDGGQSQQYVMGAFDVATGMPRSGFQVNVNPPDSNSNSFDVGHQGQRGALSFVGGKVYVPFGGFYGDCGGYHGYIAQIDPPPTPPRRRPTPPPTTPAAASATWPAWPPTTRATSTRSPATPRTPA